MLYEFTEQCRVGFVAHAPLHSFKGWAAGKLAGGMDIDLDLLQLLHLKAVVPTSRFETGDRERTKAMRDYFALEKHPETSFTMTECRAFTQSRPGCWHITVQGILAFAGVYRQLPIGCLINHIGDNLAMDLKFKWSFKAYGMKAPRLLFLTVSDIVDISAHLELKPQPLEEP